MLSILLKNTNKRGLLDEQSLPPATLDSTQSNKNFLLCRHMTTPWNSVVSDKSPPHTNEKEFSWAVYAKVAGIGLSVIIIMTFIVVFILIIRKYQIKQFKKKSHPKCTNPNYILPNTNLDFHHLTKRIPPPETNKCNFDSVLTTDKSNKILSNVNNSNNINQNNITNNNDNFNNSNENINYNSSFDSDLNFCFHDCDVKDTSFAIFYNKDRDDLNVFPKNHENTKKTNSHLNSHNNISHMNSHNNISHMNSHNNISHMKSHNNISKEHTNIDSNNKPIETSENPQVENPKSNNINNNSMNKNNNKHTDTLNNSNTDTNNNAIIPEQLLRQTQQKLSSLQQQNQQQQLRWSQKVKSFQLKQHHNTMLQRPQQPFPVISYALDSIAAENGWYDDDEDDDDGGGYDDDEDGINKTLLGSTAALDSYDKTLNPFFNDNHS